MKVPLGKKAMKWKQIYPLPKYLHIFFPLRKSLFFSLSSIVIQLALILYSTCCKRGSNTERREKYYHGKELKCARVVYWNNWGKKRDDLMSIRGMLMLRLLSREFNALTLLNKAKTKNHVSKSIRERERDKKKKKREKFYILFLLCILQILLKRERK